MRIRVRYIRCDLDTRSRGSLLQRNEILSPPPVPKTLISTTLPINPNETIRENVPIRRDVRSTTEHNRRRIIVSRGQRQHQRPSTGRIHSYSIRNIVQLGLCIGTSVQQDGFPVGLHEDLAGGEEPDERVQVDRQSAAEERGVELPSGGWREVFVGGVVLAWVVDVAAVPATTDLVGDALEPRV
jgi:hypothetical protein